MNKTRLLGLLLLLWVVAAVAGGLGRILWLGKLTSNNGLQALAADGNGGFYLASNQAVMHIDGSQKLTEQKSAEALGLSNINAITVDRGNLWLFDADKRRVFRCSSDWQCMAMSPPSLGLDRNAQLAVSHEQPPRLIIADNANHRLVTLNAGTGDLLSDGHDARWLFPNQISDTHEGLLLADTNKLQITLLDPDLKNGRAVLKTTSLPYHFVQRGNDWWVIESGPLLQDGLLRHYKTTSATPADALAVIGGAAAPTADKPHGHVVTFDATDPIALIDIGDTLVLASRDDWNLLTIDPQTDVAEPVANNELQALLTRHRLEKQAAEAERARWPYIMIVIMLPALIGGMLLQRRRDTEKRNAMNAAL